MARAEFTSETVQIATRVPRELHTRVRLAALEDGSTLQDWLCDALEAHLARGKQKRPVRVVKRAEEAAGGGG